MSSSLPKIKTLSIENSQVSGSQKNLKFKKLKLSTDANANIERFKSLKTQRLSSLQRYSTVQQQREYKNEKIHMNLLQRKLLTGTYDQTKQTGNDLNLLKQKTDNFKNLSKARKVEIEKLKQSLQAVKKQVNVYTAEKKVRQQKIEQAKEKCQKQKAKTEVHLFEKSSLDHMIIERKNINIFMTNKVNEDKAYLGKLQSLQHQIGYELREYHQKNKNLQTKIKKIQQQMARQQRTRQESIYEKTSNIQKRTVGELQRQKKSKQYVEFLNQIDKEQQQKSFNDLYFGILCNKFLQKYGNMTKNNLQEKYQTLQNKYNKMASYKSFDQQKPLQMVKRFTNQKVQEQECGQKIKRLEKKVEQLQKKKEKNEQNYERLILTTSKNTEQKVVQLEDDDEKQKQDLRHERQILKLNKEQIKLKTIVQEIGKWSERYGRQLEISLKKNNQWEDISKNLLNVMKVAIKETKELEESKIKQELLEQKRRKRKLEEDQRKKRELEVQGSRKKQSQGQGQENRKE